MQETLKEIFLPRRTTVLATVATAVVFHVLLVSNSLAFAIGELFYGMGAFWQENLIAGLPYLQTDNTMLKFATFFALIYIMISIVLAVYHLLDNSQNFIVKQLRRRRG